MVNFPPQPPAADVFYYHANCIRLMHWVRQSYADILPEPEQRFFCAWDQLEKLQQCLLVRLLIRKPDMFRLSKLSYPELGGSGLLLPGLVEAGLVSLNPLLTAEQLDAVLSRAELEQVCRRHQLPVAGLRKSGLLQSLEQCTEGKLWSEWWPENDILIKLECQAVFKRICLLFFGNSRQSLNEFVLSDLGVFRYEEVPFAEDNRPFQSIEEVYFYEQLLSCRDRWEESDKTALPDSFPDLCGTDWLDYRRDRLLYRIGHEAERQGVYDLAVSCYRNNGYYRARERLARVLEKQQCWQQVLEISQAMLSGPQTEAEEVAATRIHRRAARKLGMSGATPPTCSGWPEQTLILPENKAISVERVVQAYFSAEGEQAFFTENDLFNGLFGLLFWDALFAPVRGAFFHPFQSAPADLYRPEMKALRTSYIKEGFRVLEQPETFQAYILSRFDRSYGIQNPFVHWSGLSPELLQLATSVIPAEHLTGIFSRLWSDLRQNRNGFPDLICFNGDLSGYRLIEVKGPGDRLQDNQKRWLNYFVRQSVPAEVVYVQWQV